MSTNKLLDSTSIQLYKWAKQRVVGMMRMKSEDYENEDENKNTEETLEDEVDENDIKTENVDESLEPVEVDKAD
jgi:hypothetical protein